jgi:hypothetical protein
VARKGVLKLANHWASPSLLQAVLKASGKESAAMVTMHKTDDDARLWDLRCLGILLLQLHTRCEAALPHHAVCGAMTHQLIAEALSLIPHELPDAARSLISACLTAAPAALTAERLQQHPYLYAQSNRDNRSKNATPRGSTPRQHSDRTAQSPVVITAHAAVSDGAVDSTTADTDSESAQAHNASTPLVNLGPQQSGCAQQQQRDAAAATANDDDDEYASAIGERSLAQVAFLKTLSKATG